MATQIQKIFLVFNNGELFHKPGLIVSISSGNGGAYPVSELHQVLIRILTLWDTRKYNYKKCKSVFPR